MVVSALSYYRTRMPVSMSMSCYTVGTMDMYMPDDPGNIGNCYNCASADYSYLSISGVLYVRYTAGTPYNYQRY